ncbi:MAG TPA: hypothetical protein VIJ14_05880 [Rhabdochlamydiaceae bacterium]
MSERLHDCIEMYNILENPTNNIYAYLSEHKTLYKVALIVNHLFRAASMTAFMMFLSTPPLVSAGICFAGSLFYRLTVETRCAYKFALPAFAGAAAFLIGKTALIQIIRGVAFASLGAFATAFVPLIPLASYTIYILLTVDYDVG